MSEAEWDEIRYDKKVARITRDVIGPNADPTITSVEIEKEIRTRLADEEKRIKLMRENQGKVRMCTNDLADK
jgi:hypothetical protein